MSLFMKKFPLTLNSLWGQLLLSFIALVLLSAVAIGLPAIWLLRDQLDRQAWAQVDQGSRAAQALYAAQQNELAGLAVLTAQRPSLRELLQKDHDELLSYLRTLQTGASLDLILICGPDDQPIAQVGQEFPTTICGTSEPDGFYVLPGQPLPQIWLLAGQAMDGDKTPLGRVIVGSILGDEFTEKIHAQTGLEHTLLTAGRPVATSFKVDLHQAAVSLQAMPNPDERFTRVTFAVAGQPYYAARLAVGTLLPSNGPLTLGEPGLEAEVALPVANVIATQQRLVRTLLVGIASVAAVGSILGAVLARRISQPLARLTKAATRLSRGDLTSPVPTEPRVREIALVAWALEAARLDLQSTLNDLRREKAWSSNLLESIVEGIVTLDLHGRITFFSHGAERITGWSREEVIGRSCDEVLRPAHTGELFSQLMPALGRRTKITLILAGGRQATLAITGAKLSPEGAPTQVALVFRDVSEEELMHRLVGQFLSNIAHEFRTPLSALAASVELLLDQSADLSPAELQELLSSLHLGVLGLQTLIDNLLESASIEAGRFRVSPRPANLAEIIADVSRTLQPLLARRCQVLKVDLPGSLPQVQADPRRTGQVLVNLLSNASKYGPDATEINLAAMVENDWVRVLVADRGPGISEEFRRDLFRRFMDDRTAHSQNHAQAGAGLGLSVVKAVVEAQGGQVGVDDRPGGGAVFWFTLPLVQGT
jgi:PAS domain S-box-containing protein